jgi:hypothetical protein
MKITSILGYCTHDKQKLKQYMTTKPNYRRFYMEFCTQKMKANKTTRG